MSSDSLSDHICFFFWLALLVISLSVLLLIFQPLSFFFFPPLNRSNTHCMLIFACPQRFLAALRFSAQHPPGSDMCINPIQSLQSPLLVPLWALSPRSWGSGHTWCSWILQRFAWQHLWCRSPQPTARCSRGRKRRPNHRWHTGNIECWEAGGKGKGKQ